jgi:multisubunit Na+/H+ antiporter MnhG subunit
MTSKPEENLTNQKAESRRFGLTVGCALGILGGLLLWRGKPYYPYFLVIAAALILSALILPRLLGPIHRGWIRLGGLMGWVMTRVVLIILFYVVLTPVSLLARLSGKDFLELGFDRSAETYWIPRDHTDLKEDRYERQY